MNRRQQNTHAMHVAVLTLLDSRATAWTGKTPAVEAVAALRGPVEAAAAIARERDRLDAEGLTDAKAEARDAMEAAAMRLVEAVRPYARVTKDTVLLAEVNVTAAWFDRASDAGAVSRAERIRAATAGRLADLAGYEVTQKDVDALAETIAAFSPTGAVRDAQGGQREARTGTLAAAFRAARKALKVLDDVVPGVVRDAELAAEYRRVRRTDDR